MSDKNLTAVDWLMLNLHTAQDPFGTAKKMEKQQHETSFKAGFKYRSYIHDSIYGGIEYWDEVPKNFDDYYKDTHES